MSEMKDVWEVARPKQLEKVLRQRGQSGTESKDVCESKGSRRTRDELGELGDRKRCQDGGGGMPGAEAGGQGVRE